MNQALNVSGAVRLVSIGVFSLALSSCGIGRKMVQNLTFVTDKNADASVYYTGFDAQIDLQGLSLPPADLPIHSPKDHSLVLGTLKLDGNNHLSVRIDLAAAAKVSVLDGTLLPNGRVLPMTLPSGVVPIAFPVGGSNSKIYVALGTGTIMAGVAVTLNPNLGGTAGDILKTQMNLFFPFNIDPTVAGTVGMFSGSEFGLGVFAVKNLTVKEANIVAAASGQVHTMSSESERDVITPLQEMSSKRKAFEFYDAIQEIEELELK